MKKVLILGITGMLGHKLFSLLSRCDEVDVYGTSRGSKHLSAWISDQYMQNVFTGIDADNFDTIIEVFSKVKPDVVINCIGIIKQLAVSADPIVAIPINALLPHELANLCNATGARLVCISTDCVFDGLKGNYIETDQSNASDLYGRTKFLGEVPDRDHVVTLRTSIIGHELRSTYGLVDWFLSQEKEVNGYTKAIFSGFPTVELASVILKYVIPNDNLKGLYQVASRPISKFDLISLIAKEYRKNITIMPYADFAVDRSLDATKFKKETGYEAPSWESLVKEMHTDYMESVYYKN